MQQLQRGTIPQTGRDVVMGVARMKRNKINVMLRPGPCVNCNYLKRFSLSENVVKAYCVSAL